MVPRAAGARGFVVTATDVREGGESIRGVERPAVLPVLALVGRPNTGKSTLFNRIIRSRRALVASTPGVTRDRNISVAKYEGHRFLVVDTGGFEGEEREELSCAVREQSLLAAQEADVIVVVVDGRAGSSPLDHELLGHLRGVDRRFLIAVNKIDTPGQAELPADFYALGVDTLYPISAEHGLGVADLLDAVVSAFPTPTEPQPAAGGDEVAVAIIGRPNVGKSSLLNRLVGESRSIVARVPGTTRDAVDTPMEHHGKSYLLVDTAGVRRRPKVSERLERASVVRALRALERADVAVLVIDAAEGMTEQDARISGYAWDRGRALVLVVNKWDTVCGGGRNRREVAQGIDERFPSLTVVPKLFVSALTGEKVGAIWSRIDRVTAAYRARVPTPELNRLLADAVARKSPPRVHGRRLNILYGTQTATAPPTFTLFAGNAKDIPASYERYLVNQVRARFGLEGTPIRLRWRARSRRRSGRRS